jgi:hypothetical protein
MFLLLAGPVLLSLFFINYYKPQSIWRHVLLGVFSALVSTAVMVGYVHQEQSHHVSGLSELFFVMALIYTIPIGAGTGLFLSIFRAPSPPARSDETNE